MSLHMRAALKLAATGLGRTSPNPVVGAIIVKDGREIGRGMHKKAGGPHAEIEALHSCVQKPVGATMYVTLEPCFHHGKTGPCVDALLHAGIRKVVVATRDRNPFTAGKSIAKLRESGIEVEEGDEEAAAVRLNQGFFKHITTGLPFVTIKGAMTLDGKLGTRDLESKWITSEEARRAAHKLRDQSDAILVGANTVRADDPALNARLAETRHPLRVILHGSGPLPKQARVFNEPGKTLVLTNSEKVEVAGANTEIVHCPSKGNGLDLREALRILGKRDVVNLLVEGGGRTITAFIEEGLADRYVLFIAPMLLGDTAAVNFYGCGKMKKLTDAVRLNFIEVQTLGKDIAVEAIPG